MHNELILEKFRSLSAIDFERRPILNDVSIVIPTLGRPILEQCFYWIVSGSAWPGELIIVDQGSSPVVETWIGQMQDAGIHTIYVPSTQHGRAAGINRGLEKVRTKLTAITDDDCFVDHQWLSQINSTLEEHDSSIVTGRVEPVGSEVILKVTSRTPKIYRRPRLKFDSLSGGNMGTYLAVIERVGFFDEDPRLQTAEDGEWAYRALRSGVPIIYTPDAIVHHFGWRDEGDRANQYRNYARSHGGFYGKYMRRGDLFIAFRALIHHARALRLWIRGLKSRDQELACLGKSYFTSLLPGMLSGMRRN